MPPNTRANPGRSKRAKQLGQRNTALNGFERPQTPPTPAEALTADQLMSAAQLAERWQVPKSQVWRLTRDGHLPTVRIGRYYRYQLAVIEEWERTGGVT